MKKFFVPLLFLFLSDATQAQWKYANFPDGGQVMSLLHHGNTLFAGTPTGVFQSTNNADNWLPTYQVSLYNILCLVSNGNDVYAGTDQGVYKTTDKGINWTKLGTNGIDNKRIHALSFNGNTFFVGTTDGVFLSTDNGNTWTPANNVLLNSQAVYGLHVEGNNLLAGTYPDLYLSIDTGKNWTKLNAGSAGNIIAYHFAKSKHTLYTGGPEGLFSSTDEGSNWIKNTTIPIEWIYSLAAKGDSIFAGSDKGVYASYDDGSNWELLNKGLVSDSTINCIDFTSNGLYAGTRKGVYYFDPVNQIWIQKNKGLSNKGLASLTTVGSNLFAGTYEGTFLSTDSSKSWIELQNGIPFKDVALSFGLTAKNNFFMCTYNHGMLLSTDGGKNWILKNKNLPSDIWVVERISNKLYAGTASNGLFVSIDEGDTWSPVPTVFSNNLAIYAIASQGNNIYLGTTSGFLLSKDNGITWLASNNGLTVDPSVIVVNKNRIFVGGLDNGVFFSDDNGSNWTAVSGLPSDSFIFDMDVNGTTILAASLKSGVYASTDNGENWKSIQDNIKNLQAGALTIQHDKVFVGINGSGVWYRKLSEITPGIAKNKDATVFFEIYPNPSKGIFFVRASTPIKRIELLNPLGQLVYSSETTALESKLDLSDQMNGIFIVRLISKDGRICSRKIIIQ